MNSARLNLPVGLIWASLIFSCLVAELCYRLDLRASLYDTQNTASTFVIWYFGGLVIVTPFILVIASKAIKRRGEETLKTASSPSLKSIGTLIDSLSDGDGRYEKQCREALIKLLPLLNGDNAYLVDEYRQARLRYVVSPPASPIYSTYLARLARNGAHNVTLRVAIIEALSRIGDGEALTMLDELLECKPCTANERRIQQAASETRPALAARVEAMPERQSLLRPADIADRNTLVRVPAGEFGRPTEDLLHVND